MRLFPAPVVFLAAACLLVAACLFSIALGPANITLHHTLQILGIHLGLPLSRSFPAWEETTIINIRLPRILTALFIGGSLALAGSTMQGIFRNPLADPSIIGLSSGGALGAVAAIYFGLAARYFPALPLLSFLGATITAFLVYGLSTSRGHSSLTTLLLAGLAVGSFNTAVSSFLISLSLKNFEISKQIIFWTLGGLDSVTWAHVHLALPLTAIGSLVILVFSRDLDSLSLGEVFAASVGVDVQSARRILLCAVSFITGICVAVSGIIGFVGLLVPHIVRLLIGPSHRVLLPASWLSGAAFLVLCDIAARTLVAPEEVRLGVITAFLGAPFFLVLLVKQARGESQ